MSVRVRAATAAAAILLAWTGVAHAQSAPPPLEAYGALPAVEHLETSPSGDRLALVTVTGEGRALVIIDPARGELLGRVEVGLAKVRALSWIGDDHLMITITSTQSLNDGGRRGEFRIGQIYDVSRRRLASVLDNAPGVTSLLYGPTLTRAVDGVPTPFVRAYSAGSGRLNLYRIDPATGRGREAVRLDTDVDDLLLNSAGQPVARSVHDETSGRWSLQFWDGRTFVEAWSTVAPLDAPSLVGLAADGRSVIVSAYLDAAEGQDDDGATLFQVDAAGTFTPLALGDHPTFLLFHPTEGRLIGAAFERDTGVEYRFLDEVAQDAWTQVAGALEGRRPELVGWSDDLKTVAAYTSGPGDAGSYHVIDLDRRTMNTIGQAYPGIPAGAVGEMRPVSYEAADGLRIQGYLTLPPGVAEPTGLPLVVLAHGGPQSRDEMGFDWWAQALASRGYAVLQANFRGSTGRGRAFVEAGHAEWGRKMQTDLSDGVRWLASQGIVDPARVCIMGASYGGYAALAGPTLDRGVYRCAVSVAGVSDLRRMVAGEARGRANTETVRYWNRFMGAARLGDRAIDDLSPALLADQADAPILLIHGRDDTVVPIEQSRVMERALRDAGKPVEFVELEGEDHWMSRTATRQRMLAAAVAFLESHNPVSQGDAN
jgi:dipeptidyl aminopeptidase/acylaminoacyl peptidase